MKIRQGFGSNSSSASYQICVNMSKENLLLYIISNSDIYSRDEIITYYNQRLEQLKTWIDTLGTKHDLKNCINEWSKLRVKLEDELKDVKVYFGTSNENDYKILERFLKLEGINIEEDKILKRTKLKSSTAMHNDYVSSMNRLFMEICLHILFEKGKYIISAKISD